MFSVHAFQNAIYLLKRGYWQQVGIVAGYLLMIAGLTFCTFDAIEERALISETTAKLLQAQRRLNEAPPPGEATHPRDFIATLQDPPSVAAALQTLQFAADREQVKILSVQTEDHPAATNSLGHREVRITFNAPYPGAIAVLQEVLNRYPGSSLHHLSFAHDPAPRAATSANPLPMSGARPLDPIGATTHGEATFFFWSRPESASAARPFEVGTPRASLSQKPPESADYRSATA